MIIWNVVRRNIAKMCNISKCFNPRIPVPCLLQCDVINSLMNVTRTFPHHEPRCMESVLIYQPIDIKFGACSLFGWKMRCANFWCDRLTTKFKVQLFRINWSESCNIYIYEIGWRHQKRAYAFYQVPITFQSVFFIRRPIFRPKTLSLHILGVHEKPNKLCDRICYAFKHFELKNYHLWISSNQLFNINLFWRMESVICHIVAGIEMNVNVEWFFHPSRWLHQ